MPPSSLKVKQNQKLKYTQRSKVPMPTSSTPTTSETNGKSILNPISNKHTQVSPMAIAGRKQKMMKSKASFKNASLRKHPCSGYATLLDIMMKTAVTPASTILPTEELVPNSYHQSFHVSRWTAWLRETPLVFISLWMLEYQKSGQRKNEHALSSTHLLSYQLPHICIPSLVQWFTIV
jgi:hypothetical protein